MTDTDIRVGSLDDDPVEDTSVPTGLIAAAAIVTALLTLVVARFTHPAVGPDAVSYLAVSNSIRTGGGIAFWLEDPLLTWPPLWPALIAGLTALTRLDSDVAALILNSLAAAACVPAGFAVARRVLRTRFTTRVMLVSLAVSPVLIGLAVLVQTEVLFALVTLGVLLALMRWIDDEAPKWLVIAGALCRGRLLRPLPGDLRRPGVRHVDRPAGAAATQVRRRRSAQWLVAALGDRRRALVRRAGGGPGAAVDRQEPQRR